ncbi:TonB-dependent receptor plug domain-containing protein [Roseitranquillus sediminis]|uniref:TonB-dependent receptor plug domain-containing protein n=1 Tax=Roseitranquillus sediminis TaxID=2809051 RepID=UPI001D0C9B08|nr:TonB-dependent receptor [Roseitranquillus sediminis]MBM9593052.1 TonB-dependent receptor [Roseitranquillus sediminis]
MRRHAIIAATVAATATSAGAQVSDGIVRIGGLTPIGAESYGRAYSVVTAEEIAERQYTHVADVLRSLPGVTVSRAGTVGGLTAVRIRGAEGNHTMVLVDGVPLEAPETGEYDFGGLLAANVERIEVLRGPQSSLYGANAIGGVISITTRQATEPGTGGTASAEVGSDDTRAASASVRLRTARSRVSLGVARRETGGFDVSGDPDGEDDENRINMTDFRGAYDVTETTTAYLTFLHATRRGDYDPETFGAPNRDALVTDDNFVRERDEVLGSIGLTSEFFGGRLATEARLGFVEFDDRNYEDGHQTTATASRRRTALLQGTWALDAPYVGAADHTLTFALDYDYETFRAVEPDLVFDPSQLEKRQRDTVGAVVEYRGALPSGLDLQLGLRHDENSGFEDATIWSVGASYPLADGLTRIHASAGTGVQKPTLLDQFGFFPGQFVGNPDLESEQSIGFDIGIERRFGRGVIDVTYFRQVLTDEIATVYDPVTFLSTAVNEDGESDRQGVEVAASYALNERVDLGLAYTWLDASDPDGGQEVRRPEHHLAVEATYLLPNDRTELTLGVEHVSGLVDFDFTAPSFGQDRVSLDDYTLVDVAARHHLTERVDLTARVENLFDAEHEEVYGYDSKGRTAYLGVAARF